MPPPTERGTTTAYYVQGQNALGSVLIDEEQRVRFFGLTAFVGDAVARDLVDSPQARLGFRLLQRPELLLSRLEIGRHNAGTGAHLVVLNQGYWMPDGDTGTWGVLLGGILEQFQGIHRGYQLASIIGEAFDDHGVRIASTSGAWPQLRVFSIPGGTGEALQSIVFWLTREQAAERSSPLLAMFRYDPPIIHFTPHEQALLTSALEGATNGQLATELCISTTAVKSRWKRIIERVVDRAPGVVPVRDLSSAKRQAQVRHLVLDYVRHNRSELTPFERRATPRDEDLPTALRVRDA